MITIESLVKRHGVWEVFHGVSLEVRPSRVTEFTGPNGAGKSSIPRCPLGLDRVDSGRAPIGRRTYHELREPLHTVRVVLDGSSAHPSRTARSHLGWVTSGMGISRRRATEVLDVVGLSETAGRRVHIFFLGMGQCLRLAAALLGDPEVLILDEPVDGLGPKGIRWIHGLLRQWADTGGTVLLSNHVLVELAKVIDDVVVIVDGRVRAAGMPEEVTAGYANLEEAFFPLIAPVGSMASGGASQAGRTGRVDWTDQAEREDGGYS